MISLTDSSLLAAARSEIRAQVDELVLELNLDEEAAETVFERTWAAFKASLIRRAGRALWRHAARLISARPLPARIRRSSRVRRTRPRRHTTGLSRAPPVMPSPRPPRSGCGGMTNSAVSPLRRLPPTVVEAQIAWGCGQGREAQHA